MDSQKTPQMIVIGMLIVVLLGAMALSHPSMVHPGFTLSAIDAVFMSTSAISGTGLAVLDVAAGLTPWGKFVLMVLMEIGGLGIMALSSVALLLLGRRLSMQSRSYLQSEFSALEKMGNLDMLNILFGMVIFAVVTELAGAAILFVRFSRHFPADAAAFHAVFHSVSAFCTAGLSTFSTSLNAYFSDPWILWTCHVLMFLGEIGFVVVIGIYRRLAIGEPLSIHSKMVLVMTTVLIAVGCATVLIFDRSTVFSGMGLMDRLNNVFFFVLSGRATGFTTVWVDQVSVSTLCVMLLLMFIGGSPGSTASGLKTTTFGVFCFIFRSLFTGRDDVEVKHRRLPQECIARAVAVTFLMLGSLLLLSLVLFRTEASTPFRHPYGFFFSVLFEAVSALGNIGYTMGLTPHVTDPGKAILSVLMFIGRIGPLTLALAIAPKKEKVKYRYPVENIMIG